MKTKKLTEEEQEKLNELLIDAIQRGDFYTVETAVEAGADINAKDKDGNSILFKTMPREIDIMMTQYLLETGVDPNVQNSHGWTALHKAVDCGQLNKINLLLKHKADMYVKDRRNMTPLDLDLYINKYDAAELFISAGYIPSEEDMQKIKNNKLFKAIKENDIMAVKTAVEAGADVNAKGNRIDSPLHESIYCNIEIVKYLIKTGADVNTKDCFGSLPLHRIIDADKTLMEYMLEAGANPNIQDRDGNTPLNHAVTQGYFDKVKLLLRFNADMYITDKDGVTPFVNSLSGKYYDIAELMVLNGYVPSETDYRRVKNYIEKDEVITSLKILVAQVQEHKERLKEEIKAASQEFACADEVMEM